MSGIRAKHPTVAILVRDGVEFNTSVAEKEHVRYFVRTTVVTGDEGDCCRWIRPGRRELAEMRMPPAQLDAFKAEAKRRGYLIRVLPARFWSMVFFSLSSLESTVERTCEGGRFSDSCSRCNPGGRESAEGGVATVIPYATLQERRSEEDDRQQGENQGERACVRSCLPWPPRPRLRPCRNG